MDILGFENLMSEIMGVSDEQRAECDFVQDAFLEKFNIDFDLGYELAKKLILHTVPVDAACSTYHCFLSRKDKSVLMFIEAE